MVVHVTMLTKPNILVMIVKVKTPIAIVPAKAQMPKMILNKSANTKIGKVLTTLKNDLENSFTALLFIIFSEEI